MAARLRVRHQDEIREKIRASQLINRLENHAFGELELSPSQIKAIEVLLDRSLPKLSAVEHAGELKHTVSLAEALESLRD